MHDTVHIVISREVSSWPGVTIRASDRNGQVLAYGRVELGHLHGSTLAHLPFPRKVRDDLLAQGRVTPHPVMPDSGWSERRISGAEDVADVIGLFRLNYDRVRARVNGRSDAQSAAGEA